MDHGPAELRRVRTDLADNTVAAMHPASGEGAPALRTSREHDRPPAGFRSTGAEIRDRVLDPSSTPEEPA